MIARTTFFFSIFLLLILSCAKQSTPTGGPKDSIPPILIKSFPAQKQLNFKGKTIELTFSETVILNNPKEQILITPSTGKSFDAVANKRNITIEFENDLSDSTTYTLNFRDAIQDITEKNPAKNLQLAFSTGSYIDSLSLQGNVFDLINGKDIKDATVALYQHADTFNIFKHKPSYITKTDPKGNFKLENLKAAEYFIYAFDDKNKNLIADSKNESYGFLSDTLHLKSNIRDLYIPLIRLDARPLKLSSLRPYNNYFNIRTTKTLVDYKATADSTELITSFASDRSNVKVFNYIGGRDSLEINFTASDSINNTIDSTFYIKFNKKESTPEKFTMTTDEIKIAANKGTLDFEISFSKPIATINFDSIYYTVDSLTTIPINEQDMQWAFPTNTVAIKKNIDISLLKKPKDAEENKAQTKKTKSVATQIFTIGKGAFISIDGDSSASKKENVKILREEDTGVLIIQIVTDETNFHTQLLDKDFKTLQTVVNNKSFKIENLPPAQYMIRLVIDKNQNGKWDPGNFFKKQQPEPMLFYRNEKGEQTINLKANWELGPLLIKY